MNNVTRHVLEILEYREFCVIDELIEHYHRCKDNEKTAMAATSCLRELGGYIYPKRRAVDVSGSVSVERPLQELPDHEILNLLPEAIQVLQKDEKVKENEPLSN